MPPAGRGLTLGCDKRRPVCEVAHAGRRFAGTRGGGAGYARPDRPLPPVRPMPSVRSVPFAPPPAAARP
jgi:hypothetical protein